MREDRQTSTITDEPLLTVRRPRRFFLRRRFLRDVVPFLILSTVGFIALLGSGSLRLPFERLVTLEGKMGSKADLFSDEQVKRILLRHHLRVHVTRMGSREAATSDLTTTDFVFASGQPPAVLISEQRRSAGQYSITYRPFVSPIVLATYREYAETLRRNNVATPQPTDGTHPLYYDLDLEQFLRRLVSQQKTWDQLGIGESGLSNGNRALAQSPSVCTSNSAATYLGLVSYVIHHRAPTTEREAVEFATEIKPLLRDQGLSAYEPELYFVPEGRQTAPIIVVYEHQYLSHQVQFAQRFGRPDHDRVLLYPTTVFETQPSLIALTTDGDRLGALLTTDPQLRRRELELGFRVLDPTGVNSSNQLPKVLAEQGVPAPSAPTRETKAVLPEVPLLEKMISVVGDC